MKGLFIVLCSLLSIKAISVTRDRVFPSNITTKKFEEIDQSVELAENVISKMKILPQYSKLLNCLKDEINKLNEEKDKPSNSSKLASHITETLSEDDDWKTILNALAKLPTTSSAQNVNPSKLNAQASGLFQEGNDWNILLQALSKPNTAQLAGFAQSFAMPLMANGFQNYIPMQMPMQGVNTQQQFSEQQDWNTVLQAINKPTGPAMKPTGQNIFGGFGGLSGFGQGGLSQFCGSNGLGNVANFPLNGLNGANSMFIPSAGFRPNII